MGDLLSRERGKLTGKTPSTDVSQNCDVAECTPAPVFCKIIVVTTETTRAREKEHNKPIPVKKTCSDTISFDNEDQTGQQTTLQARSSSKKYHHQQSPLHKRPSHHHPYRNAPKPFTRQTRKRKCERRRNTQHNRTEQLQD